MIQDFEEYAANLEETASMDQFQHAVVGIEAAEFLNRISKFRIPETTRTVDEALLAALGGLPFGLEDIIKKIFAVWKDRGIKPVFVFSGLDVGRRDVNFLVSETGASINVQAWNLYANALGDEAVLMFGKSTLVTAEDLFRFLQKICREQDVAYQVAPYGAWAQLAYLLKMNVIDAIYGSSEVLLYDVPAVITSWDFVAKEVVWVKKRACLQDLSLTESAFVDACMLAGNSLVPTIPQLQGVRHKQPKLRSAAEMVMRVGHGDGHVVCRHFEQEPASMALNYIDLYRRARLSVKHHVVLNLDGKVEPFDVDHVPQNLHEVVGQRLPDELYFYLSKGLIGARILNWRTSNEIVEPPPLDGGDSEDYRNLVGEQLTEMRVSAIFLLSQSLHFFYQHKNLSLRCWFSKDKVTTIEMKDVTDPSPITDTWNVHEDIFRPESYRTANSGCIGACVKLLSDPDFAAKTITLKDAARPLETESEILLNSTWRLLHLRGYVDEKHNLTPWGHVLNEAISSLQEQEHEESAFVAVEMARLSLLNADNMFPSYIGKPYMGSEKDKRNALLVSRVMSIGKFHHQEIGYTGPLSRDLLGYHCMVTAVRSSLRDLAEVCLTTLFLKGDANRDRTDWTALGLDLPFLLHNDCVLGLAVNAYLMQLVPNTSTSAEAKEDALHKCEATFKFATDFRGDLKKAFAFWDAVYKGVKGAPSTFQHKSLFEEVNGWLAPYR